MEGSIDCEDPPPVNQGVPMSDVPGCGQEDWDSPAQIFGQFDRAPQNYSATHPMFLPTMPGDTKSRHERGLILANKIRVQNAISKRPTNAYQFLVILSYLHREWIAMQHFKFAREHE